MKTVSLQVLTTAIRAQVESARAGQSVAQSVEGHAAATTAYCVLSTLTRELAKATDAPREFATLCGLPNLKL